MSADGQMPDAPAPVADAAPATDAPQVNDALMARLDEMQQQIGKLATPAEEPQWQGGIADLPYQQQGFDPNQGFEPAFDQYGNPQQDQFDQQGQFQQDPYGQQQPDPMQQLDQLVNQRVEQSVAPIVSQYQQMVQNQKATALEAKYPQLKDPKFVGPLMDHVVREAQRMNRPEDARDPDFVELVFLAQQARSNASQETPADGGNEVHLESGGAAPHQEEVDPATRMLQAWNKV